MKRATVFIMCFAAVWATVVPAMGKNVDLSTVPGRQTVQLTIYNSEDLTLVRETRLVSFKRGVNPLQFSWANTLIDPTSVELRFPGKQDRLEVLDTTFPHDKPQMLYWNVASEGDGEAKVEISYFTSGITWSADYTCITTQDEAQARIEGFVRVTNHSGEDYEKAQVRLVVGTVNLVEQIAQLARVPMSQVAQLEAGRRRELRQHAAKKMMFAGDAAASPSDMAEMVKEKQIIKQGLSEYFIYTIDGTETIPNGWSKRMRSFEGTSVPVRTQYRYRPAEYGDALVRMYLLTNDKPSGLGETPLPDGVVRVFRHNGRDGLSFVASQSIKYIPIGDKIELNLGQDPSVIFELVKRRAWRDAIWMKIHGANVYREIGGGIEIDPRSTVAGWDEHVVFNQRVRNYTGKPIDLEIRRALPGHVVFRSGLDPVLHDYQTVQYSAKVPAGQTRDLVYERVLRQGRNAKQNNITLEKANIQL